MISRDLVRRINAGCDKRSRGSDLNERFRTFIPTNARRSRKMKALRAHNILLIPEFLKFQLKFRCTFIFMNFLYKKLLQIFIYMF